MHLKRKRLQLALSKYYVLHSVVSTLHLLSLSPLQQPFETQTNKIFLLCK